MPDKVYGKNWLPKQFPESYLLWQFTALITEKTERNHTRILSYSKGSTQILRPSKPPKPQPTYRNPIFVAKEYANRISSGEAKNESDLARKIGISRVRIWQYTSLLGLNATLVQAVEALGDPMPKRLITERQLRQMLKDPKGQESFILELKKT